MGRPRVRVRRHSILDNVRRQQSNPATNQVLGEMARRQVAQEAPPPPATDMGLRELLRLAPQSEINDRLGLAPETRLQDILDDPSRRNLLTPNLRTRAGDFLKEANLRPRPEVPTKTPSAGLNPDKGNIFKRFAKSGVRFSVGQLQRLMETEILNLPLPPPEAFQKDFGGASVEDLKGRPKDTLTAGDLVVGAAIPFDVAAETGAELAAQVPKPFKAAAALDFDTRTFPPSVSPESLKEAGRELGEIEAPTVLTKGPRESLRQFEARSLKEQLLLSLVDPTLLFGGGRMTTQLLKGSFKGIKSNVPDAATLATQRAAVKDAINVPAITPSDDLLNRVQPQGISRKLPGPLRRVTDPSSEIPLLPVGSPERIGREAQFIGNNASQEGLAHVEVLLAKVKTQGDVQEMFGIPKKITGEEPRASKITGKDDSTNPYFGDVFENRQNYNLTPEQDQWIVYVHEILDEALVYWQKEGLDVAELGKLEDAFFFFPRRLRDERGKLDTTIVPAPSRKNVGRHRTVEFMEQMKGGKGEIYDGPMDVLAAYFQAGYADVARLRAEKHASVLARSQVTDPLILTAKQSARNTVLRMKQSLDNVKKMKFGFVPPGSTVAAMKRNFPLLAERIDVVAKLKPTEVSEVVSRVSKATLDAAKVTKEQLAKAIDDAYGIPPEVGRPSRRSTLQRTKVMEAIEGLRVDAVAEARLIKETTKHTEALFKETRGAEVDALVARMKQLQPEAAGKKTAAERRAAAATVSAQSVGVTEGRAPSLSQNLIFDAEVAANLESLFERGGTSVGAFLDSATSVVRALKTTTDFGAPFIQGLPILFRDPAIWAEATTKHFQAFLDPAVRTRYIAENALDITDMVKHGGLIGSSEFTEALAEGGWFAKLPYQITQSGLPLGPARAAGARGAQTVSAVGTRFGSAFELFLDMSRVETWKALRPIAKNQKDLDELASYVNKLTGTSSSKALGVPLTQRQIESALILFSPRYTRAMGGLFLDMFRGSSLRGEQARKSISQLMMGVVAVHVAGAQALGQDIRLDPTKPAEFLRWDIGGQRVGPGSKGLSMMKTLGRVGLTAATNPQGFLSWNAFTAEAYQENPILSFIRNQSSLITTNAFEFITGSDPIGQRVPGASSEIDVAKHIGEELFPFWLDAAIEGADNGLEGATTAFVTEFGGGTSFPIPSYLERDDLFEKYAQSDLGMSLEDVEKDLNSKQLKEALIRAHPDLAKEATNADLEASGRVNQEARIEFRRRTDLIDQQWSDATHQIDAQYMQDGTHAGGNFRENFRLIGAKKQGAKDTLKDNPNFAEVIEGLEEFSLGRTDLSPELAAQQEFFDRVTSDEVINQATGRTNYPALSDLRRDIDDIYGDGMMSTIDKAQKTRTLSVAGGNIGVVTQAYIASFETLRDYWEVYKQVLPEDRWRDWELFDAQNDIDQERVRALRPDLAAAETQIKAVRDVLQRSNKEIDRALVQFYDRTPLNLEFKAELIQLLTQ